MPKALIINSIVCALGVVAGGFLAMGSIISIANMKTSWSVALLVAAVLVPVTFLVSGAGAWLTHRFGWSHATTALMALPWIWSVLFVSLMFFFLKN